MWIYIVFVAISNPGTGKCAFLVVAHPDSNTMKANVVNIVFIVLGFKVLLFKGKEQPIFGIIY